MSATARDPDARRVSWVIFFTLLVAYGYFHQGGGWTQNVRFDQVRSVSEEGTWWINRFCAYEKLQASGKTSVRRRPLADRLPADFDLRALNSWDVSLYDGRIYPNKPPGTTLLALPAYALTWRLERLLGLDPDSWLGLTAGLYVTTVFSIGLVGALGGVIFFRVSRRLFPDLEIRHHAAATLAFALGTIYFPFATMLFDHVATATALLAGFALLLTACDDPANRRRSDLRLIAAGAALGFAVVLHYTAIMAVGLMTLYLARRLRRRRRLLIFALGAAPAAILLAWYHQAAFGSPTNSANSRQLARFMSEDSRLFGLFGLPDPHTLWQLLFSEYRGLFIYSPVLLLACYGLGVMLRRRQTTEAVLLLAVFAAFLGLNASFNGWHGGATFGPRYLIPVLPFLALPLAIAFARLPVAAAGAALLSTGIALLGTATRPMIHQNIEHPLIDVVFSGFLGRLATDPVAAGGMGIYELNPYALFGPNTLAVRWNAFNLGEALFPQSRVSLVPLIVILILGTALAVRQRQDAAPGES